MSECLTNLFGRKRCRFVARYDVSASKLPANQIESVVFWNGNPADFSDRTYVCDVCVVCGRVSKRP